MAIAREALRFRLRESRLSLRHAPASLRRMRSCGWNAGKTVALQAAAWHLFLFRGRRGHPS